MALTGASVAVFVLFCEFVLFRFVWHASDVPMNAFLNQIVRYLPEQRGVWRVRDDIAAPFAINRQGWNSGRGDYTHRRADGVERIAFVGDSFVEGLQVAFDKNFGDVTAQLRNSPSEAYRFGIAGAPMSQYLHMIEREVEAYRPDWVVVLLVHNDFDESFRFRPGRYTSSFRKLRVEGRAVLAEIPPEPYESGWTDWLRRSATARFLLYRWQVRPQLVLDLILGPARAGNPFDANIDIATVLALESEVRATVEYLTRRMKQRVEAIGARLLIVIDGNRGAIYTGRDESEPLRLNRIAAEAAAQHGVAFLDLDPVFRRDWQVNRRRFEFQSDAHWNEHGHRVAAGAVAEAIASRETRP